jgi:hypothetical protein
MARVAGGAAIGILISFAVDAAWVRLRLANHRDPTSRVQVTTMYAVTLKSGRTEFDPGGTDLQSCVRALFPHLGLEPCWYVERHTSRQVHF